MEIADLITPRSVIAQLRATNKKQALQELAKRAAALTGAPERTIYDVLIERERLGTTGIGMGIGIPHGRLPGLDRLCGVFARLERPVPFEAIDDQPVDLIFSSAGARSCRIRPPESTGAGVAAATRSRNLREAARDRQRRRALRSAD